MSIVCEELVRTLVDELLQKDFKKSERSAIVGHCRILYYHDLQDKKLSPLIEAVKTHPDVLHRPIIADDDTFTIIVTDFGDLYIWLFDEQASWTLFIL